jgi:ketosteroid isomerase-like protein
MQSAQDFAKLAGVDRDLIEARIHAMLDRRVAKDLPGLITFFSDELEFELIGNWSIFPHARRARGKEAWVRALTTMYTEVENLGSTINDIVIDGEWAALRRSTRMRHYGTGRVDDIEVADFMRFRNGLVVEFTEIVDSMTITRLVE